MSDKYTVGRIEQLQTQGTDTKTGLQLVFRSDAEKEIESLRRTLLQVQGERDRIRQETLEAVAQRLEYAASLAQSEAVRDALMGHGFFFRALGEKP